MKLTIPKLGGVEISTRFLESEKTRVSESQNSSLGFTATIFLMLNSTLQKPVKSALPPDKKDTEGYFPLNVTIVS